VAVVDIDMGRSMKLYDIAMTIIPGASIAAIAVAAMGYILKTLFENRLERFEKSAEELRNTSLALKHDIRNEERGELVAFRVAVEKWENFLQTLLFDFSMMPALSADVTKLYASDKELYLEVRLAVVRASTYLRNQELELQLMAAVSRLRQTYYPLIGECMPKLIDLQAELAPIEMKLKRFADGSLQDPASAPSVMDREKSLALQQAMTNEIQEFSTKLIGKYQDIAEQLVNLKEGVNQYIYRPIKEARVDAD
jgi:hypothetical protein